MPDDTSVTATWPDRFVYVCIATRANIVNLAPLVHAGQGRIVGLVILRGLKDPENPSPEEAPDAVMPARQLSDYAEKALNLVGEDVVLVDGDPDLAAPWTQATDVARKLARARNASVLFNVAGGRRPVMIGALVGIAPWKGDVPLQIMSISQRPFRARLVVLTEAGVEDQLLPINEGVPLEDYLAFNGLVELGADNRRVTEGWYSKHDSAIRTMEKATGWTGGVDRISLLNRLAQKHPDVQKRPFRPYSETLDISQVSALQEITKKLRDNVELDGSTLHVQTRLGHKFITGHWLEALLRKNLTEAIGPRNDVEIVTGLRVGTGRLRDHNDERGEMTDFDLVVYADNGIDIIEAKAITDMKGLHAMIDKLQAWRARLGGPNGKGYIVAPLLNSARLEGQDMFEHAAQQGIVLLCGRTAVKQAVKSIAARFTTR